MEEANKEVSVIGLLVHGKCGPGGQQVLAVSPSAKLKGRFVCMFLFTLTACDNRPTYGVETFKVWGSQTAVQCRLSLCGAARPQTYTRCVSCLHLEETTIACRLLDPHLID